MTSTDLAPTETYQARAIKTRSKPGKVTGKLADAIGRMIENGEHWDDAARAVGLTARTMRKALNRPHVQAYIRSAREVFRNSICTANIRRLAQIRDAADNMPAVNAIKALEQIGDEQRQPTGSAAQSPGLVIVINGAASVATPSALTQHERDVQAKPLIEHTFDSHEPNDSSLSHELEGSPPRSTRGVE